MRDHNSLLAVIDFGDLPLFTATAYPSIAIIQRKVAETTSQVQVLQIEDLNNLECLCDDLRRKSIPYEQSSLSDGSWNFDPASRQVDILIRKSGFITLKEYTSDKIFTGLNLGVTDAYVIDSDTRDALVNANPQNDEVLRPYARGRDVKRWCISDQGNYVLNVQIGTSISKYPDVLKHLRTYKERLSERTDYHPDSMKWWELRQCAYYDEFDKPKIVYPDIAATNHFAFDRQNYYGGNTLYIIPMDDLYLLAILNSSTILALYEGLSTRIRGGYLRFTKQYMRQLPICTAHGEDRNKLQELAEKCLDARGEDCEEWERQIDERVARLYGL